MIQDALAQIDDPSHIGCASSAGKTPEPPRVELPSLAGALTTSVVPPPQITWRLGVGPH